MPALTEVPPAPARLGSEAAKVWQSEAPQLVGAGLLTPLDMHAFARYCLVYALWSKQARHMEEADHITESSTRALGSLDNALRKLEAAFGMSPADRAGMKLPERPAAADPFAKPALRVL